MGAKEERKRDAEDQNGHIYELIHKGYVVDKNSGSDYIFISYSSKDWKRVLYDIVYDACIKKGLKVYFDTKFDTASDSWLTQFRNNMNDGHCKGVLAFVSSNYKTSYATLMELMASQETSESEKKTVLPIYIDNLAVSDYSNTGLGTERFADSSTNDLWRQELKLFNELFLSIVDDPENTVIDKADYVKNVLYKKSDSDCKNCQSYKEPLDYTALECNSKYWELLGVDPKDDDGKRKCWNNQISAAEKAGSGDIFLNKNNNSKLVSMILSNLDKNNIDGVNKNITNAIYEKLSNPNDLNVGTVFDKNLIKRSEDQPQNVTEDGKQTGGLIVDPPKPNRMWKYCVKGIVAYLEWDGESKNCTVKEGSRVANESNAFANLGSAKKMKDVLLEKNIIVDRVFACDYVCDKISTMINVLTGGAVSMPKSMKDGNLKECDWSEWENRKDLMDGKPSDGSAETEAQEFVYSIWGQEYSSTKLSDMMHCVFDKLAEKYPKCVPQMAKQENITAVALKREVDEQILPSNKLNYFKAKKEHVVDGVSYYVSTRYNREQGIEQLRRMVMACGETEDAFEVISYPGKVTHNVKKRNG